MVLEVILQFKERKEKKSVESRGGKLHLGNL